MSSDSKRPQAETPGEEPEPTSGWAGAATERGHFRPDIEGLRAVAVLAVLLFHAGVPGFGGGFIGVDVFFVISGFLITGLLRRELLQTGRVDLASFYARRSRRLLPAALVVIAVTVVASALLLPRVRFPDVVTDGAAAALYVANYRFALQGLDYLTDETTSPLLHYWSLGVEEQFYLFWPLLLLVGARLLTVRRLWLLIAIVGAVSFALAIALTHAAAPLAFYSLPTRAWQLAIGALLAVAPEPLSPRVPPAIYRGAGLAGLALIVVSAVAIDPQAGYPGLVALAPTLGAAAVIASGVFSGGIAQLLAMSVPRWIGRISYSLYLWHWPLLILVPIAIGADGLAVRLPLAVLSIGIAHVSTRWIEQRFRVTAPRVPIAAWRTLGATVAASVLVAGVSFGLGTTLRAPARPSVSTEQLAADLARPDVVLSQPRVAGPIPPNLRNALAWAARDVPPSRREECQVDRLGTEPTPCVYGDETSNTTVILFGDSHAAQWLTALRDAAEQRGWRLVSYLKSACPPLTAPIWSEPLHRPYDECTTWLQRSVPVIAAEQPDFVVVSGARHYAVLDGSNRFPFRERPLAWQAGLAQLLTQLRAVTPNVVLLADTPRNETNPIDCLSLRQTFEQCELWRDDAIDTEYAAIENAAVTTAGVRYVSMNDMLCPDARCPLAFGDYIVYRDSAHLTATFTRFLSSALVGRLTAETPYASTPASSR